MIRKVPDDLVQFFTILDRYTELAKAIERGFGGVADIVSLPADRPGDLLQDIRVLESPGSS